MATERVHILLCTRYGAHWLPSELESLRCQTHPRDMSRCAIKIIFGSPTSWNSAGTAVALCRAALQLVRTIKSDRCRTATAACAAARSQTPLTG